MATTFTSTRYKDALVKLSDGERVRFSKGHAEVEGDTAERLRVFAESNPDLGIEVGEDTETESTRSERKTRKQALQEEARERGLDDSGTIAELEARIAKHDEPDADESDEPESDESDEDDFPYSE